MGWEEKEAPSQACCPSPDPEAPLPLRRSPGREERCREPSQPRACTHRAGFQRWGREQGERDPPPQTIPCAAHEEDHEQSRVSQPGHC